MTKEVEIKYSSRNYKKTDVISKCVKELESNDFEYKTTGLLTIDENKEMELFFFDNNKRYTYIHYYENTLSIGTVSEPNLFTCCSNKVTPYKINTEYGYITVNIITLNINVTEELIYVQYSIEENPESIFEITIELE